MEPLWEQKWQCHFQIFMTEIETRIFQQSNTMPRVWKRYIDDIFSLWDSNIQEVALLIKLIDSTVPLNLYEN